MLRAPGKMLTQAARRWSIRWRAKRAASSSESQVVSTTILSVMGASRCGLLTRHLLLRPRGDFLFDGVGVLGVGRDGQVLLVGVAGGCAVLQSFVGFGEFEEGVGRARIPAGRFQIALGGSAVVALLEIEVACRNIGIGFQGIESVLGWFERLILFGRLLFFGGGWRSLFALRGRHLLGAHYGR